MGDQKVIRMKAKAKFFAIDQFGQMSTLAFLLAIYASEDVDAFCAWVNEVDESDAERITPAEVEVMITNMAAFTAFMKEQSEAIAARRDAMVRQFAQARSDGLYPPDDSPIVFRGTAQEAAEFMAKMHAEERSQTSGPVSDPSEMRDGYL
jgi:hypothetical protein